MKKTLLFCLLAAVLSMSQTLRQRVVVLPALADPETKLNSRQIEMLTDKMRSIATKNLPINSFNILKPDYVMEKLGGAEALYRECKEGTCIGTFVEKVQADFGVRCEVFRMENKLWLKFELYGTLRGERDAEIISTFTEQARDVQAMLALLDKMLPPAFKIIVPKSKSAQELCEEEGNIWVNRACKTQTEIIDECESSGKVWENNRCRAKTNREICESSGKMWDSGTCKAMPANSVSASVGNVLTDSRDGKKYRIVKIGTQTWMAENLNYNVSGSKCHNNKQENYAKYGKLYDWNTAMKACPSGWHLPSYTEWNVLRTAVGGETAGLKLKAKSGWYSNGNGIDNYGFSALPGGFGGGTSCFVLAGYDGYWWSSSSSELNSDFAYFWSMSSNSKYDELGSYDKTSLLSIRCIKD